MKFFRNFNLFPSVPPSTNEFDLRNQRISTRLFIILLFLSTTILIMYTSLVKITKTTTVKTPTFTKYSQLYLTHSQTLTCPCTTISINYDKFLRIQYTFHQVCSSIFVTRTWTEYLSSSSRNMTLNFRDFRASHMHIFQTLNAFCELTNKIVSESLSRFYSNQYISATVTSSQLFQSQIQSIFTEFVSSTTKDLLLPLEIIRLTTQANALFSGRWTNYDLHPASSPRLPGMEIVTPHPNYYSGCRCDLSVACVEQSAIYDSIGITKLFSIPGLYFGCFAIEALFQSTLECFYNQSCIDQLQSYLIFDVFLNVTALDSSLSTRFFDNSTIQELVNELMVERWNRSILYENYYNACQPAQCIYSYDARNDAIYISTALFGLVGGLVTILNFLIPRLVKLIAQCLLKRQRTDGSGLSNVPS